MKLIGFAFGIRISRSFHIEDKLGAITDYILYSKGTEFGPSIFPQVQDQNDLKILFNEKTSNRFSINHSDFIFEYTVKDNFDAEFTRFLSSYSSIVTKDVFREFKIRNIMRFGFIIKAEIDSSDCLISKIESSIKDSFSDYIGDSLSLRFNIKKKNPVKLHGIITEDFDNRIITYNRASVDGSMNFSVDFQKYFKPELFEISDANQSFEEFCKSCKKEYENTYLK